MVNHFNFNPDITPSIEERSKRRAPFARMTEAKSNIRLLSGNFRGHLDALDKAIDCESKLGAAIEIDAALGIVRSLKSDLTDLESWVKRYTQALSDQTAGGKKSK